MKPPTLATLVCQNMEASVAAVLLPHVVLWDPIAQFPMFFQHEVVCPTAGCTQTLSLCRWNSGSSAGHCPRFLHDMEHITLLVPAVYQCKQGHQTVSTDPRILMYFKEQEHIPFILLHRSGMTRDFARTVIHLAIEGLAFTAIERFVINRRLEYIASIRLKITSIFQALHGSTQGLDSSLDSVISYIQKPYPSNDLICKCLLHDFLEHKTYYFHEMALETTSGYLSIDHTFKVAANLGYVRPDGRWVSQYKSVLIVLNNKGKIIAWQLTKTTSLDEVTPMLTGVSERLGEAGASPKIVCVDNCCTVRNKLQHLFGDSTKVYLDIFHAAQRILKHMPKRHPLYSHCKYDISMIFRDPKDRSAKRQMNTPEPRLLLDNVNQFVKKWENAEMNGWYILNENVVNELCQLKVHIERGCLSGIPPGCGTNKNENLHRMVNPFFSRCRMGLPLALALLTILFHKHNQKLSSNPKSELPILHARTVIGNNLTDGGVRFGILDKGGQDSVDMNSWIFGPNVKEIPNDIFMTGGTGCIELHLSSDIAEHVTVDDINNIL